MTTAIIDEFEHFFHISDQPTLIKKHLARLATILPVDSGTTLFSPDIDDHNIYYLISGEVRIERKNDHILIKGGTAQAHFPLSEHRPHQATAITTKPSKVLKLPWEILHNLKQVPSQATAAASNGVTLEENEEENDLYMEFYNSMKEGKLELPSMPDLAVRLIKTVDNADTDSKDIASIIQLDPSLTTRILNVANSPVFMGLSNIDNCPNAVTRLGRKTTRNLVISFTLKNLFKSKSKLLNLRMSKLWKHGCHVAAICHVLGKITPSLQSDNAMLSGIIHDIGSIPLLSAARDYPQLMENPALLDRVVNKLRGEIGAMTLKQWNFAEEYIDVALHAEDWLDNRTTEPTYTDLVLVAQLHSFVGKPMMKNIPRMDLVPAFHKLALGKLSPKLSIKVLDKAKDDIAALERLIRT